MNHRPSASGRRRPPTQAAPSRYRAGRRSGRLARQLAMSGFLVGLILASVFSFAEFGPDPTEDPGLSWLSAPRVLGDDDDDDEDGGAGAIRRPSGATTAPPAVPARPRTPAVNRGGKPTPEGTPADPAAPPVRTGPAPGSPGVLPPPGTDPGTGGGGGGTPSGDGILLSRAELMALPTSGPGWDAILQRVRNPYGGSYALGVRDDSNKDVLAHALAGARLGDSRLIGSVRDKIAHMISAPRNSGDVLGTLRHLSSYIISADLIDLGSVDPDLDARFRSWLGQEVSHNYSGGGGGGSVISVHDKKPNNFGTHAGAVRIAAALYLGDAAELKAARDVWYGWATGDSAFQPSTRKWTGTSWQCGDGKSYGINPVGCSRGGVSLDGVIPEDQERCGEFSPRACATNYVHGATDGMTLSFWMLARNGEDPWSWGDRAALRQMRWKYANGQPPYSGFRWQIPVIERAYGVDLPGNAPTATSTNVGFADWWAR